MKIKELKDWIQSIERRVFLTEDQIGENKKENQKMEGGITVLRLD